ncbi:GNAT family N-acetyltransferase [Albimonas pacifica]|uniref:Acetyltransferase (GNAT) family protein n=1 Tax=Albimonas pacifica TaxID=1114924 RepID=A0A1I3JWV5_9RHOB|nr:GNAT family N-acetyltransferase [Albimonas pacifica]SFI64435.1 Acetyltransferase (GNAT) family protein [Albimonas pacifica]
MAPPVSSDPEAPSRGEAEGLTWRRNRPVALEPLAGWFRDAQDMAFAHPFARFPFDADEWEELLTRPSPAFFYAERDGVPFAHFGLRPGDDAVHLCFLVMDPARRGQGLARPLIRLTAAAGRARMPGARRMTLNVSQGNLRAERLYLSLGFRRTGGAEEGMFQMERPLGPQPPWDRP